MNLVTAFLVVFLAGLVLIPFLKGKVQSGLLFATLLLLAGISGVPAWQVLSGSPIEWILSGNMVTGDIPLRLDALSAWFILIINFIFITGGFYGLFYLRTYSSSRNNLSLHYGAFLLLHGALLSLTVIQNSLVFLVFWELMTLAAFVAVIFEHEKWMTIKAGLNFFIQSHVSLLFLMTGFIYAAVKTGSYDFATFSQLTGSADTTGSLLLLLCFITGFGIKAGFVPFHTWLPYAHPAAPAHISGIMSGVIIKIGLFGILRMLLLLPVNYTAIGYLLLAVSLVSGLYGVMLAIVQHNLKKLLAYHSIENIGIIGMGTGIGCIGLGAGNPMVASLGFAGALLHILNHALFKSLLFYTAGNVYQATHTLHIEHLGGLMKKMPHTAILFLIAAIAICGIPPFNGFISEFLIYTGLYHWIGDASLVPTVAIIFAILGLVLIGGFALLCFTKAFGIVFLGNPRQEFHHPVKEVSKAQLAPMYVLAFFIVGIGAFPQFFLQALSQPVGLLAQTQGTATTPVFGQVTSLMQPVAWSAWGLIAVALVLWGIRKLAFKNLKSQVLNLKSVTTDSEPDDLASEQNPKISWSPTWSCGYVAPTPRLQYTAGSFVRSYTKLFRSILIFSKKEKEVTEIFPVGGHYESHAYDKLEKWLIDAPVNAFQWLMGRFLFLQNGKLQVYILYGILFILSVIAIPLLFGKMPEWIEFLKTL